MPFDDFFEFDARISDEDLAKLDNMAAKAEKRLEKSKKELENRGGIFGGTEGPALPKSFLKKQQELALSRDSTATGDVQKSSGTGAPEDLKRKTAFDELKEEQDVIKRLLENEVGLENATTVMSFLRNPTNFMKGLFTKFLPILAGLDAAREIVEFVIEELTKKGRLLDVWFNDKIEDRLDAFRDKLLQQEIRFGFTQVIITNRSGLTSPRDAYNTFELAENNRAKLNEDFSIRTNTRGYSYG